MALMLPKESKKVSTTYTVPEDGVYKVIILQSEDKVDQFEDRPGKPNKRKGNSFYNLRVQFENGRTRFERIDYQNKEGYREANGYNFILAMTKIVKEANEVPAKLREILENKEQLSSDEVFNELVKYKVPFYIPYRNSKGDDGRTFTNINSFIDPFYDPENEDIIKELQSRKINFVSLGSESDQEDNDELYETSKTIAETEEDDY